jgi:hypothetical protein
MIYISKGTSNREPEGVRGVVVVYDGSTTCFNAAVLLELRAIVVAQLVRWCQYDHRCAGRPGRRRRVRSHCDVWDRNDNAAGEGEAIQMTTRLKRHLGAAWLGATLRHATVLSPCYNSVSVAGDSSATGCGGHNRRVASGGGQPSILLQQPRTDEIRVTRA